MTKLIKHSVLLVALFCTSAAFAGTFTFSTAPGATETGGNAVNAQAIFTTGNGTLEITLNNLLVNPKTVAQNISDLFFTLNNVTTGGSLTSSSGTERTVAANGTFTDGSSVSTGWVFSVSGGTFHLDGLNSALDVPAHTIIGAPNGSNVYSNANNSITGNGPHNPFLRSGVTFDLAIAGINADTVITGATFSFGTTSGDNVPGGGNNTPDSGMTLVLLAIGLAVCEFGRRVLSNRLALVKIAQSPTIV
jgi:hypothetical protein